MKFLISSLLLFLVSFSGSIKCQFQPQFNVPQPLMHRSSSYEDKLLNDELNEELGQRYRPYYGPRPQPLYQQLPLPMFQQLNAPLPLLPPTAAPLPLLPAALPAALPATLPATLPAAALKPIRPLIKPTLSLPLSLPSVAIKPVTKPLVVPPVPLINRPFNGLCRTTSLLKLREAQLEDLIKTTKRSCFLSNKMSEKSHRDVSSDASQETSARSASDNSNEEFALIDPQARVELRSEVCVRPRIISQALSLIRRIIRFVVRTAFCPPIYLISLWLSRQLNLRASSSKSEQWEFLNRNLESWLNAEFNEQQQQSNRYPQDISYSQQSPIVLAPVAKPIVSGSSRTCHSFGLLRARQVQLENSLSNVKRSCLLDEKNGQSEFRNNGPEITDEAQLALADPNQNVVLKRSNDCMQPRIILKAISFIKNLLKFLLGLGTCPPTESISWLARQFLNVRAAFPGGQQPQPNAIAVN